MKADEERLLDKRIELAPLVTPPPPAETLDEQVREVAAPHPELPSEVKLSVSLGSSQPGRAPDRVILHLDPAADKVVLTDKVARTLAEQLRQGAAAINAVVRKAGRKERFKTRGMRRR